MNKMLGTQESSSFLSRIHGALHIPPEPETQSSSGHQKDEGRCFTDPQVNPKYLKKRLDCFYGFHLQVSSSEASSHPNHRFQQAALGVHAFWGEAGLQLCG